MKTIICLLIGTAALFVTAGCEEELDIWPKAFSASIPATIAAPVFLMKSLLCIVVSVQTFLFDLASYDFEI